MYAQTSPNRRRRQAAPPSTSKRAKNDTPRGLFVDRIWHCDCQPRLPANSFIVKKDSPNKGRKFWTCQQDKDKGCGFFLWNDEAEAREKSAVINNSHTEVTRHPTNDTNTSTEQYPSASKGIFSKLPTTMDFDVADGHTTSETESEGQPSPSRSKVAQIPLKRSASQADLDKDDYPGFPGDDDEVAVVLRQHESVPRTPRKMTKISTVTGLPTPDTALTESRKLPWKLPPATPALGNIQLHTPSKTLEPSTELLPAKIDPPVASAPDPSTPVKAQAGFSDRPAVPAPDPVRHRDAVVDQDFGESEIATRIQGILSQHAVPSEAINQVCGIVSAQELKTKGILRGRDATRLALQRTKDELAVALRRNQNLEMDLQKARASKRTDQATALRR